MKSSAYFRKNNKERRNMFLKRRDIRKLMEWRKESEDGSKFNHLQQHRELCDTTPYFI